MPEARPQRQMVDMDVVETSGVDHPAHGFEGWLVKKSAGRGRVARLENILKGTVMATTKEDLIKEVEASKVSEPVKEFVRKSIDLTDDIEAAAELWQSLRAKQEAGDPETPTVEAEVATPAPVVAAAPAAPAVGAEVFKALDADSQAALAKATAENPDLAKALGGIVSVAKDALEKAAREEAQRLDAEAVQLSKSALPNLAVDHDKLAPAMRKLAGMDPDVAAEVQKALEGANVLVETAELFKERGTSAAPVGSAMEKAAGIAAGLVAAGTVKTTTEGIAKAFEMDPSLYTQHEKENS